MKPHVQDRTETDSDYLPSWISLLGLLEPLEFFVSVNHFRIWRRHIAWAKTSGKELRIQITQRFSSSMVFMSLLLGAELGVLFSPSDICSEMRKDLREHHRGQGKYWIGITIIMSVCVTIMALMATYTAWGMVLAISDENMHCIIRSSFGQYVTQRPADLVVLSLYLFLLWVIMFMVNMLSGIMRLALVGFVAALFFQVVITYSAFGRLILHTGAMGKKRVLDPELEKALLPSGLQASLVMKATTHSKQQSAAVVQYRTPLPSLSDTSSPAASSHQRRRKCHPRSLGGNDEVFTKAHANEIVTTPIAEEEVAGYGDDFTPFKNFRATTQPTKEHGRKESYGTVSSMERAQLIPPLHPLTAATTPLHVRPESHDFRMLRRSIAVSQRPNVAEWNEDDAARELYGAQPPATFDSDSDVSDSEAHMESESHGSGPSHSDDEELGSNNDEDDYLVPHS